MGKDLYIFGAGGAGRELAFSLSLEKDPQKAWNVIGFIDDDKELWGKSFNGLQVIGGSEELRHRKGSVALCTVANPKVKRAVVSKIKDIPTIDFPLIISPLSIVSPFVTWGEGCIVALPFDFISVNVDIGRFVFINCTTRIGHDVVIGDFTTIFSGIDISGGVHIGADCVLGSGVTINPGVKIGNGSIIGAGSVVVRDIPDNVVAAGVPAKVIGDNS